MALKNIFSILLVLFVAASCAIEDDVINESSNTNSNTTATAGKGLAYVSVGVTPANTATKATRSSGAPTDYAGAIVITNCTVLLLDGQDSIRYRFFKDYTTTADKRVETVKPEDFKLLVKHATVTKAIAILNASKSFRTSIDACQTQADLNGIRETKPGFQLATGEGKISWVGVDASPSTSNIEGTTVTLVAAKRISLVDIIKFRVKYHEGCSLETHSVKLENFWLTNMKKSVGLYAEGEGDDNESSYEQETFDKGAVLFDREVFRQYTPTLNNYTTAIGADGVLKENFSLSTYNKYFGYASRLVCPNRYGDKKTTVHIRYSVTDSKGTTYKEAAFVVNNTPAAGQAEYVAPGFWYSLDVTVNVKKDYADCNIQCYTKDWVNEDLTIDL